MKRKWDELEKEKVKFQEQYRIIKETNEKLSL